MRTKLEGILKKAYDQVLMLAMNSHSTGNHGMPLTKAALLQSPK